MTDDTVCIVGAGCAGLSACHALRERGIPYVWYATSHRKIYISEVHSAEWFYFDVNGVAYSCSYEKGTKVGGLWRLDNDNGLSAAYESLTINTSKSTMEFNDFPFPADWPVFLTHEQACYQPYPL